MEPIRCAVEEVAGRQVLEKRLERGGHVLYG